MNQLEICISYTQPISSVFKGVLYSWPQSLSCQINPKFSPSSGEFSLDNNKILKGRRSWKYAAQEESRLSPSIDSTKQENVDHQKNDKQKIKEEKVNKQNVDKQENVNQRKNDKQSIKEENVKQTKHRSTKRQQTGICGPTQERQTEHQRRKR